MIRCGVTVVAGVVLGVTSWWHGQAGGAGTTGAVFVVAGLAVVVAGGLLGWLGRSR